MNACCDTILIFLLFPCIQIRILGGVSLFSLPHVIPTRNELRAGGDGGDDVFPPAISASFTTNWTAENIHRALSHSTISYPYIIQERRSERYHFYFYLANLGGFEEPRTRQGAWEGQSSYGVGKPGWLDTDLHTRGDQGWKGKEWDGFGKGVRGKGVVMTKKEKTLAKRRNE